MEQQIRFCTTSDGVRIAYATVGQGPPIVRVLGWFTHLEYEWENPRWRRRIDRWSAGATWIQYDGRGMGLSDRQVSDFSLEARQRDLEAVIDALGYEKVALFGISQGGPTAVAYAVRHPARVSHLIFYGSYAHQPHLQNEEGRRLFNDALAFIRQGWDSDLPAHRQFFTGLFIPDADGEAIQAFNEMQRMSTSADNVAALLTVEADIDVRELLPEVTVPTLVIHRRGDAAVPFERGREMAAAIPGARFLPLDGRNHSMLADVDVPVLDAIAKAMREFMGLPGDKEAERTESGALHTILFTDMEGSTTLTERLGDAKAQELRRTHDSIVREALKAQGGSETKHTGDGIMASFPSASRAIECAVAVQRAIAEGDTQLRVRIGLNAGEPVAEDADLFGTAVNLAKRICDQAEPGQILVSDVVQQLAAGKGFTFADKGEATLKGFEKPVRLHEVVWD